MEALKSDTASLEFIREAFKHFKTLGASDEGKDLLDSLQLNGSQDSGVIVSNGKRRSNFPAEFIRAMSKHRHWNREKETQPVP